MRRSCVPPLCAALISLAVSTAFAQAPAPDPFPHPAAVAERPGLTLAAALQAALHQHPRLRAASAEVDAADGAIDQAGVWPNPSLGVEQEDAGRDTRTTTFLLNQPIELGGKRSARAALARSGRVVADADLAARRAEVRADTVQAFFDALVAQERVGVTEESLRIAASGTAAATRRVAAGKVSPTEETRARVAESNARIELRQAEADRQRAMLALGVAMGASRVPADRLDGRAEALPPLPAGDTLRQRIDHSPLLQRARGEVDRAGAAYELERARRIPDVTLSLGTKRSQELGRNQPVIGVSIPLPVFDTNRGAQHEALRRRDAAEALARAEALRVEAEVLQGIDLFQALAGEAQTLREEVLPGARSAYEAASRGFELGKFDFIEVLDAQRTWLLARSQYLTTLASAHRAAAELERRLGAADNEH